MAKYPADQLAFVVVLLVLQHSTVTYGMDSFRTHCITLGSCHTNCSLTSLASVVLATMDSDVLVLGASNHSLTGFG